MVMAATPPWSKGKSCWMRALPREPSPASTPLCSPRIAAATASLALALLRSSNTTTRPSHSSPVHEARGGRSPPSATISATSPLCSTSAGSVRRRSWLPFESNTIMKGLSSPRNTAATCWADRMLPPLFPLRSRMRPEVPLCHKSLAALSTCHNEIH